MAGYGPKGSRPSSKSIQSDVRRRTRPGADPSEPRNRGGVKIYDCMDQSECDWATLSYSGRWTNGPCSLAFGSSMVTPACLNWPIRLSFFPPTMSTHYCTKGYRGFCPRTCQLFSINVFRLAEKPSIRCNRASGEAGTSAV